MDVVCKQCKSTNLSVRWDDWTGTMYECQCNNQMLFDKITEIDCLRMLWQTGPMPEPLIGTHMEVSLRLWPLQETNNGTPALADASLFQPRFT